MTNNPFTGRKKTLIGRRTEIKLFEQRVIKDAQSLSIIGLPCIGKTLLVNTILDSQKHTLQEKRIIPIEISLTAAKLDTPEALFLLLVKHCQKKLEAASWLSDARKQATRQAAAVVLKEYDINDVKAFFEEVNAADAHIIFIIDKFDHIGRLFPGNVPLFQGLEELAEQPDYNVTFVTLSFRPLSEIGAHMRSISHFHKNFRPLYLSTFDDYEMEEFYQMLSSVSDDSEIFPVKPDLRNKFDFYCGKHPYLLDELACEVVRVFFDTGVVDIDTSAEDIEAVFSDYIRMLIETMDGAKQLHAECDIVSKLMQAIFGPATDLTQEHIQELLNYGLIKPCTPYLREYYGVTGEYVAFCDQLQRYLQLLQQQVPSSVLALEKGNVLWKTHEIMQIVKTTNNNTLVRAYNIKLKRAEAIKIRYPYGTKEEIEREGSILATLNHPHIAKVYGAETEYEPYGLIIEWIDGSSLEALISRSVSGMDVRIVVKIGMDLAQALESAHEKGIFHRDVKPGNIIINDKNEAMLIDFDIARSLGHHTITTSEDFIGTHGYSAPEQYTNPESVGAPTDFFSLGVVLYEALAKKRPYSHTNPKLSKDRKLVLLKRPDGIPDALYKILCALLYQEIEKRLDATELYEQLYAYYITLG